MGGKNTAELTVDESVTAMLKIITGATLAESGQFMDRFGQIVEY